MEKELIFSRLQQLTGSLKPTQRTTTADLQELQRNLAEQLVRDPSFTVFGERLHHEGAEHLEAVTRPSLEQFRHVASIVEVPPRVEEGTAPPLVFRRETEFQNNLLGNSVPAWGAGMAATKSVGPFIDEHGLFVWFDFFSAVSMVWVCFKGSNTPILLVPVRGILTARKSYRIERGSVWIASHLIANNASLQGYYTGLKIRRGVLELSADAEINNGRIIINAGVNATLNLDLDQNTATSPSTEAGFDATAAAVHLPENCELRFNTGGGKLVAANADCEVFGCEVEFRFKNTAPVWIPQIGQILLPYSVTATGNSPDTFEVRSSDSLLCNYAGSAKMDGASGWLLPAAKIDPSQLGNAAGTGALCIGLSKGLTANWKGLRGSLTKLIQPAIIVEPGMLTVADFFANNVEGKQRWILWKNAGTEHHSDLTLRFGKAFPFIHVSASKGSEAVLFFCSHVASFDRPVDANGSPFVIESSIALASILQTGADFRASLFDNDLLFDGSVNKPAAFKKCSIILRNAYFGTTRPYSLFLSGELTNDDEVTKGVVALLFGIYLYLPTLPDPYVASYLTSVRGRGVSEFGRLQMALAGFVKWPDPSKDEVAEDGTVENPAYVYFKFAPLDQSLLLGRSSSDTTTVTTDPARPAVNNFQVGVRTFNRNIISTAAIERASLPIETSEKIVIDKTRISAADTTLRDRITTSVESGEIHSAIRDFEANPLLSHIADKTAHIDRVLNVAVEGAAGAGFPQDAFAAATVPTARAAAATTGQGRGAGVRFAPDTFILLDVSSNADQMGVSLGTAIEVERDPRGETNLRGVGALANFPAGPEMALQIFNMDVVGIARNLRAITLPQISWEPVWNIPLAVEGGVAPDDTVTVMPGLLIYENDGIPTRIFSESPYPVPITPLSVTRHFVKEYNDAAVPRQLMSVFTLPFAMIAKADFNRTVNADPLDSTRITFNRPHFEDLRGGLQIKSLAPKASSIKRRPSFKGWTIQLDETMNGVLFGAPVTGLLKWALLGLPITGSTLGKTVKKIFNRQFFEDNPKVPLERIEFSGYGASIFSNWLDGGAAIAEVSQAQFDVLMGRTAHEVVQVRSILYPWGVHVVRTITLTRSANGYVYRSDSGWQAESDGFFDFDYRINFEDDVFPEKDVNDPYDVHHDLVKGVSNVREIKDYADGGTFTSSFKLNDPDLPLTVRNLSIPEWQNLYQGKAIADKDHVLQVELQAVVFDADVHLDNVTSGGVADAVYNDFAVQSRKMLGYVQLSPAKILIPSRIFADLLNSQGGSIGGPVDCLIDIANSQQPMRLSRVDVSPARDAANQNIFVSAPRGALILPADGSWSVVKQQLDTRDVKVLEIGETVPLIKRKGDPLHRIAEPRDVVQPSSNLNFGIVQTTGTQKLLFDLPQFSPNVKKLKSAQTYFADAYKLLNSKGVFPNVANALALTNAEKEVEILGEGLMRMVERDINVTSLLPPKFSYAFVDEPGILRIYAEYETDGGGDGNLTLGIDSLGAAADKWKAALSNIRVVVDLGPFPRLLWVDGNFDASSAANPKYAVPNLQFGPMLQKAKDILEVLAALSGDDFDDGMKVGMSNSPDGWEYKFECSQEIPVIKFPSPFQLSTNPNPPLKLEAGLKVGFYFNSVISIPTDVKQLVPTCGAFVEFYGRIQVMCFTLAAASVYAVGQVNLRISGDTKSKISLLMKFGFGVEIVVGLPVVGNVSVLYMIEIELGIDAAKVRVGALMLFRGHAEICGGLVGVTIQIEAGGSVEKTANECKCIAQVTFSIDIQILWVIDISFEDTWEESRQIA